MKIKKSPTKKWKDRYYIIIINPITKEKHKWYSSDAEKIDVKKSLREIEDNRIRNEKRLTEEKEWIEKKYPEVKNGHQYPNEPFGKIKLNFAKKYAFWKLALPDKNLKTRKNGKLIKNGWSIQFIFLKSKKQEYIDLFTQHRMTNNQLHRYYEDGRVKFLDGETYIVDNKTGKIDQNFYEKVKLLGFR